MKKTSAREIFLWMCAVLLLCSEAALAGSFEDTVRILENRTAFHWGRDCFVWVVHYSEALVDPWVASEAGRVGMSESEQDSYRDSFISDLSIGKAEPLLVTVHAFGARPLNLSPFSEKITLVTPSGERVKPDRYDRVFDQPMNGLVQGLVFFPKQENPDFAIAMNGLGVYDERIFAFNGEEQVFEPPAPTDEPEIVVVELPPRPQNVRPQASPPIPPPAPPIPPVVPPPAPPEEMRPAEPEVVVIEPDPEPENDRDAAYISREQTLRTFLDLWVKFDPDTMYPMLSGASQERFSRQEFESELRKSSDFRNALRSGYTIDWVGAEQAKIVTVRRFLFIRTLLNRNMGVTREGSAWKIEW